MIKKVELYAALHAAEKENERLKEEVEAPRREMWQRRIPHAADVAARTLEKIFPRELQNLTFAHVDAAGYWFTFNLVNDDRRQTYAVRHEDL